FLLKLIDEELTEYTLIQEILKLLLVITIYFFHILFSTKIIVFMVVVFQ
ncbi:MAG: hypothetical protein RL528_185, partial [Bacteroidota bacterium]